MATSQTAAPLRWLIGSDLFAWRKRADMKLSEVGAQTGFSATKVQHLENGRQVQTPEDITQLLKIYGAPDWEIERLTTLTGRADEAAWWGPWSAVVADWLRTYVGLEGIAEKEFTWEPHVITGLLQTENYARAITSQTRAIRQDHAERFVKFRMTRTQRITDTERPLALHTVIAENALRLVVGTEDIRREQLRHLLKMAERPTVTIQIIRPEDGVHAGLAGGFMTLDFGTAARPVVYIEQKDGAVYLQEEDQVDSYTVVAGELAQVALSTDQSLELIESMLGQ